MSIGWVNRKGWPSRLAQVDGMCRPALNHNMENTNMIKKLMLAVAALVATMGIAFAQVDVNKADAAALDSVKGIGPAMSKAILDERSKGEFKDWADFEKRMKGVHDKRAMKLSAAGLQIGGKSFDGAPMVKPTAAKAAPAKGKADAKPAAPPAKM
jgi:competence protein ComEA